MNSLPDYCSNSYEVDHNLIKYFMHSTIVVEIPFAFLSIHCIWKVTPKHLIIPKVLLLAHQLWITVYSIFISCGVLPIAFFPYIAFYSEGVFHYFEFNPVLVAYLLGTGFGGMLFSILCLFAYRHQCVLPESHILKLQPKQFIFVCFLIHSGTILFMIPFLISIPNQEDSLQKLQNAYTNPPCDLWHPRIFIYWFGVIDNLIKYMIFMVFCTCLMIFFVLHSFRIMRVYQRVTSKSTRKRQIGFLYALSLMALIPNLFLFSPTFVFVLGSIGSSSYNSEISDCVVSIVGLHGILSTITMILSHKPYRKESMELLRKLMWWSPFYRLMFVGIIVDVLSAINMFTGQVIPARAWFVPFLLKNQRWLGSIFFFITYGGRCIQGATATILSFCRVFAVCAPLIYRKLGEPCAIYVMQMIQLSGAVVAGVILIPDAYEYIYEDGGYYSVGSDDTDAEWFYTFASVTEMIFVVSIVVNNVTTYAMFNLRFRKKTTPKPMPGSQYQVSREKQKRESSLDRMTFIVCCVELIYFAFVVYSLQINQSMNKRVFYYFYNILCIIYSTFSAWMLLLVSKPITMEFQSRFSSLGPKRLVRSVSISVQGSRDKNKQ